MRTDIELTAVRSIPPKEQGNRGFFPSNKVKNGVVEYESQIERDFFLLLNHADDVELFQHQPISISFTTSDGKRKSYTPDVFVQFNNGFKLLVEIKDEDTLQTEEKKFQERWKYARKWADKKGFTFLVLTDRDIRTPRMANIWFCLGASKVNNNNYIKSLKNIVTQQGTKFNELCYSLAEKIGLEVTKASQIICYAIYHGIVFVDTFSSKPLSKNTIVRKKQKIENSPFQPLWVEMDNILEDRSNKNEIEFNEKNHKWLVSELKEKSSNIIDKRLIIVHAWLKQPAEKRTAQWRANFSKKHKVSIPSIYRWVKKYDNQGNEGLKTNYKNSGRKSTYDKEASNLLEKARNYYLKPQMTFKKTYRHLKEIWTHETISCPSQSTLKKYIYSNSTFSDLILNKRGKKLHKSWLTPSLARFQGAIMPMQVLQFDNTSFDVFAVDSEFRESIGTPNLTAAIDCYSRMITGFELSLNPSSKQSILETLVQSILSKDSYLKQYELQNSWDIQGLPVLILVDNGADYRAEGVKQFCIENDIILEFAPIRTPRYKAYIEKWFDILRNGIIDDNLPGLRPLLKHRIENPDLNPEAKAVLTIQELDNWLLSWILDSYHYSLPYDDGVPSPTFRLEDALTGQTKIILPLPRDAPEEEWEIERLHLSTLDRFKRVLRRDGVQWEHLNYHNKELADIFAIIGIKKQVNILMDRRDIRSIWVENPIDGKPIKVGLASGWASAILEAHREYSEFPIHASAWIKEVKAVKSKNRNRITPYIYKIEHAHKIRNQTVKDATIDKKSKRSRRKKARQEENADKMKGISIPFKNIEMKDVKTKEKKKWKEREIDWSKVKKLPTSDMYRDD